jgi:RND family efflux transporter MFP subunit
MKLYFFPTTSRNCFMYMVCAIFLNLALISNAIGQSVPLSDRGKASDKNKNGLIERSEAGGPLAANFDEIDCDKNGGLDGAEIPAFFQGSGCPKPVAKVEKAAIKLPALSDRGKASDKNKNGLIERSEAGGPLAANFDEIDCDKNGGLDGAEIPAFFQGSGCPKKNTGKEKIAKKADGKKIKTKGKSKRRGGRPPQSVKLDEVRLEATVETYRVIGRITALQSGPLAARVRGAIEQINFNVGDRVEKGTVLVSLAKQSLQASRRRISAQVSRYKSMMTNAQRELSRMKKLSKSAVYSRARFEDQEGLVAERKAQYMEFKAALDQAQIDIQNSSIRAPYDSVIIEKHVEVGGYVNVGARVVTLSNNKLVEVEADIPSFRLLNLKLGTPAKIITDAGTEYKAQVRAIIPNENVRTRTRPIRLTAAFGEEASKFADNQSVMVELPVTNQTKVLTVNKDAVLRRANGNIVFIVNGTNAMMRSVRLGRGIGNKYQVISGLKAGDKVVTRGNERLGAGGQIKIAK